MHVHNERLRLARGRVLHRSARCGEGQLAAPMAEPRMLHGLRRRQPVLRLRLQQGRDEGARLVCHLAEEMLGVLDQKRRRRVRSRVERHRAAEENVCHHANRPQIHFVMVRKASVAFTVATVTAGARGATICALLRLGCSTALRLALSVLVEREDLLRRSIAERAARRSRATRGQANRRSKVSHFDWRFGRLRSEQNVLWLEVAVGDPAAVQVGDGREELRDEARSVRL
eukprot:4872289-Pleurochrysis_carterae.AAC.1